MHKPNSKIGIIIPVYKEAIAVVQQVLHSIPKAYHIYLVNDGCDVDYTIFENPNTHCYKLPINTGQGAALSYGTQQALLQGCQYFITMDSDGQHNALEIETLLQPISNGQADIVLGSRFLGKSNIPRIKKILLNGGIYINYFLFGIHLTDAHNGFRCFNAKVAAVLHFTLPRMAHASEILDIIKKNKFIYTEVPVTLVYNNYTQQKGQKISNAIFILLQLLKYKVFGK